MLCFSEIAFLDFVWTIFEFMNISPADIFDWIELRLQIANIT